MHALVVMVAVLALAAGIWIGTLLTRSPPALHTQVAARRHASVLDNTLHDVYCRLSVTEHGVGVRAVRPIPRGTDPFRTVSPVHDIVWVTKAELEGAHPGVRAMVNDYLVGEDGSVPMTRNGLNSITIDFFLNHNSRDPNMEVVPCGDAHTYASFRASRDIRAGEELTFNYEEMGGELPAGMGFN